MRPVKPSEAQRLAVAVRYAIDRPSGCGEGARGLRASTTRVLEMFLRLAKDDLIVSRTTSFIARDLGMARTTVKRARLELDRAGLVTVLKPGIGHTATIYRVQLDRIRGLAGGVTVTPQRGQDDPTPGVTVTPQRGQDDPTQRGRARDARVLPFTPTTPPPPNDVDPSEPVVVRGDPPTPPDNSTSEKCAAHDRRRCRACGHTPRQQAAAARERAKRDRDDRERRAGMARRAEETVWAQSRPEMMDITRLADLARAEARRRG